MDSASFQIGANIYRLAGCKSDHTRCSYRKEGERFLWWAIMKKGKPISSLSVEDCRDYRDFLWYLRTTVGVPVRSYADCTEIQRKRPPLI